MAVQFKPIDEITSVGTFEIPDEFGNGTGAMLFGTPAGAHEAALCALQTSFAAPSMTSDWQPSQLLAMSGTWQVVQAVMPEEDKHLFLMLSWSVRAVGNEPNTAALLLRELNDLKNNRESDCLHLLEIGRYDWRTEAPIGRTLERASPLKFDERLHSFLLSAPSFTTLEFVPTRVYMERMWPFVRERSAELSPLCSALAKFEDRTNEHQIRQALLMQQLSGGAAPGINLVDVDGAPVGFVANLAPNYNYGTVILNEAGGCAKCVIWQSTYPDDDCSEVTVAGFRVGSEDDGDSDWASEPPTGGGEGVDEIDEDDELELAMAPLERGELDDLISDNQSAHEM
jgi:hypothetical protein